MRPTKSILAFCTAILFADLPHIGAAETNQTVSLTVDLTDGSRIIGTPSMEVIPLRMTLN